MQTRETLTRRLNTLRSLKGVVRGMKMLSAVNEAPYAHAAATIEAYHATVLEGLQVVLRASPAAQPQTMGNTVHVVIVFGSDHGLCGAYNETVLAAAAPLCDGEARHLVCVGARMASLLSASARQPQVMLTPPASVDGIGRFAREALLALDAAHDVAEGAEIAMSLVHMRRDEHGHHAPRLTTLLPLDDTFLNNLRRKPWVSRSLPTFSMERQRLFALLIRQHLFASLFKAAAEAMSAENAARLALMRQAERAIDERSTELDAVLRAERQTSITSELLDVIAGMDATHASNVEPPVSRDE